MKLGKLFEAVVDIATLPVSIAKDVVTLGNFGDETYTKRKVEKISEELDEVTE
jgi:hypothetical protein